MKRVFGSPLYFCMKFISWWKISAETTTISFEILKSAIENLNYLITNKISVNQVENPSHLRLPQIASHLRHGNGQLCWVFRWNHVIPRQIVLHFILIKFLMYFPFFKITFRKLLLECSFNLTFHLDFQYNDFNKFDNN